MVSTPLSTVEAPGASGLSSNFNYILTDGGNNITGLSVTINIDNDFVSSANGFSFQLNGYADVPTGSGKPAAQHYVIYVYPNSTALTALVENWYWTGSPLVARNSSKVLSSADDSLNCQVVIVDDLIDKLILL